MDKMLNPDGVGDLMNNQNWKDVFGDMNVNWPK